MNRNVWAIIIVSLAPMLVNAEERVFYNFDAFDLSTTENLELETREVNSLIPEFNISSGRGSIIQSRASCFTHDGWSFINPPSEPNALWLRPSQSVEIEFLEPVISIAMKYGAIPATVAGVGPVRLSVLDSEGLLMDEILLDNPFGGIECPDDPDDYYGWVTDLSTLKGITIGPYGENTPISKILFTDSVDPLASAYVWIDDLELLIDRPPDKWETNTKYSRKPLDMGDLSPLHTYSIKDTSDHKQTTDLTIKRNSNFGLETPAWNTELKIVEQLCDDYQFNDTAGSVELLIPSVNFLADEKKPYACRTAARWNWIRPTNFSEELSSLKVSVTASYADKIVKLGKLASLGAWTSVAQLLETVFIIEGGVGSLPELNVNYLFQTPKKREDISLKFKPSERQYTSLALATNFGILGPSIIWGSIATLNPITIASLSAVGGGLIAMSRIAHDQARIPRPDFTSFIVPSLKKSSATTSTLTSIQSINDLPESPEKQVALLSQEATALLGEYFTIVDSQNASMTAAQLKAIQEQAAQKLEEVKAKYAQINSVYATLDLTPDPNSPNFSTLPAEAREAMMNLGMTNEEINSIESSMGVSPWLGNASIDAEQLLSSLLGILDAQIAIHNGTYNPESCSFYVLPVKDKGSSVTVCF